MDCVTVVEKLLAYHLATLEEDERSAIDEHLLGCTECLRAYFSLKHASDASVADRPSPLARARLRAEVARSFAVRPVRVAALRRPIPLYQGIVAVAVAAAIALLVPAAIRNHLHKNGDSEVGGGKPNVDTSREGPRSLTIY